MFCMCFFFVFKQKTAYEMRISDWSSDVCSSDLTPDVVAHAHAAGEIGRQLAQEVADGRLATGLDFLGINDQHLVAGGLGTTDVGAGDDHGIEGPHGLGISLRLLGVQLPRDPERQQAHSNALTKTPSTPPTLPPRSETRRVGQECVRKC